MIREWFVRKLSIKVGTMRITLRGTGTQAPCIRETTPKTYSWTSQPNTGLTGRQREHYYSDPGAQNFLPSPISKTLSKELCWFVNYFTELTLACKKIIAETTNLGCIWDCPEYVAPLTLKHPRWLWDYPEKPHEAPGDLGRGEGELCDTSPSPGRELPRIEHEQMIECIQ